MEEGIRKVSEAVVKQYNIDKNIELYIEKKVPKPYLDFAKKYGVWGRIIIEQKVEYRWEF